VWIETAGCTRVEVPAHVPDFQLDIDALDAAIGPATAAVIINSPNNPVGAVYTRENLEALAALLARKEAELGRKIYVISDEPYREITYGAEVPYVPCVWPRTIVCYSYSKSFSLPGERIGYIYVSDLMDDAAEVSTAVAGAGRALGFICAPVLFQRVIARCIDEPSDVAAYAANRELLTTGLGELGYGSWNRRARTTLRALEDDAAFSDRAKAHELLLVPSDSFGVGGWCVSYCVSREVIERSMPASRLSKNRTKAGLRKGPATRLRPSLSAFCFAEPERSGKSVALLELMMALSSSTRDNIARSLCCDKAA
ncbi:MAG: aminotransferase class I/II-fold pyridoxal phosphate-dependent enzyme, partial [Eggerthellaceae bacterium]